MTYNMSMTFPNKPIKATTKHMQLNQICFQLAAKEAHVNSFDAVVARGARQTDANAREEDVTVERASEEAETEMI